MITSQQNWTIVRLSAGYDLITVLGFVAPWSVAPTLALVLGLGSSVGLAGNMPSFDATQMLFVNLMGSAVLVWALARLAFPTQALGRFDALSRALFAIWEIRAVSHGAPPVTMAFTIGEIAFGLAELLPVDTQADAAR